ncbi:Cuticle protein 16.8 like protein [Argiope bruennichi]|uniref:Cuticle protein 16.8 like protein n=1 Tax=Argiope bruennichi TaxID=94029 RepID=A0A8T0E5Y6_ARGBR|nr:Cuticle protein 16.8 like protein [Argiope bruennichi]
MIHFALPMDFRFLPILLMMAAVTITLSAPVQEETAPTPVIVEVYNPYNFGYEFGDGVGMTQHKHESSDINGEVKGSYGYTDPNGLYRSVEYTAGVDGYKAIVRSNEPGLSSQDTADVTFLVEPPSP